MIHSTNDTLRLSRRRALAVLAISIMAAVLPSFAQAAPLAGSTGPAGSDRSARRFLYTNLNTAGTNTAGAFRRNRDGSLTALPNSPIAVGGQGTGATTPSQGAIQTAFGGRLLLVTDPGSNEISVLSIHADGTLAPVSGSPFASGGILPVSIAVHSNLVYVANGGTGGSNYTGFHLQLDGTLSPIDGSTYSLPDGSQPGDVLFDGTGQHLGGTRVATSLIDSFHVDSDGRISPVNEVPFAAQGPGPFGSVFRPSHPAQLFVSNAHGGTNNDTVSAFDVTSNGRLISIGVSPFSDFQTAPCWVEFSPDGRYIFVMNTGSGSISSYKIAPAGSLTLIGSVVLNGGTTASAFDLRIDPSGRTLYVIEDAARAVGALAVHGDGTLTEMSASPFALPPTISFPFGLAVT